MFFAFMPGDVFLVNLNSTCFTLDLLIDTGDGKDETFGASANISWQ